MPTCSCVGIFCTPRECLKSTKSGVAVERWEIELLGRYFTGDTLTIIAGHGSAVAGLALNVCHALGLSEADCRFVEEAALLHDIGVCRIQAPRLGLEGGFPYIMHGIIGREILEGEGLPRHALVCERHIGVGLTVEDIIRQQLPLPQRDMTPRSTCERIICFADLFYSKNPNKITFQKSPEQVRNKLAGFGDDKVQIFEGWMELFGAGLHN
ncbi:MAG: HDIG domain-containing protein [Verrucomicrobia bacterium]|nr:HDIG domain-containing protein [Deltaproteobacteria bacterium]